MTPQFDKAGGVPGDNASHLLPTAGAMCVIFLFYSFVAAALLFLAVWIALELIAGFVGGRLRWAFRARQALRAHFTLARVLLKSLRLRKTAEACVPLAPQDAPGLFSMLESLCLQMGIHFPPEVFLEMDAAAWVRLKGSRRGAARVLGLGLDLLAGTTESELEAVIAHELSHAKLTQHLVRTWLSRGLERATQLSRGLSNLIGRCRGKADFSRLARVFLRISEGLAEAAAHRIAAYSRREEFAADRSAAELVGPENMRSALLKVQALSRVAAGLAWRERIAQLQAQTFSQWLVNELSVVKPLPLEEVGAQEPDRFSTHPPLRDRLNALSSLRETPPAMDKQPAIRLLIEPDNAAQQLIAKIAANAIQQEEKDSRKLRQWAQEMRAASDKTSLQKAGAGLVVAAEIAGATTWIFGAGLAALAAILAMVVVGIILYRMGRRREGFVLPLPDFGLLRETWETGRTDPETETKELEAAIRDRVGAASGRRAEMALVARMFELLAECDYVRAHVAAKMLLDRNPQSLPGLLASAISSAWLGYGDEMTRALASIQKTAGLNGRSVCWGVAWTYLLRGNWARAEALLERVLDVDVSNPTLLNLRALCQLRRGKLQSAIIGARRACEPRPVNREHAKFLIDLLLEGGYMHEAQARLLPLDREIPRDHDLMLAAVRLDLSSRNFAGADRWTDALTQSSPPAHMIVQLAAHYELSRQTDRAERLYREALALAYYPDACLGLARVEAGRGHTGPGAATSAGGAEFSPAPWPARHAAAGTVAARLDTTGPFGTNDSISAGLDCYARQRRPARPAGWQLLYCLRSKPEAGGTILFRTYCGRGRRRDAGGVDGHNLETGAAGASTIRPGTAGDAAAGGRRGHIAFPWISTARIMAIAP